ncbi:MAG TPA: MFS transporter, partial [Candidatus Limnocylindrales bacterium]|nr:MFS transporter [Candidatus Limnocylindrales bacterium]
PMPRGEHVDPARDPATSSPAWHRMMTGPLLLLGLAIGLYVASEMGVSSWLVRFLEPAPLTTATLALTLYWAGIAAGRAISSVIADRFDHRRFTITCSVILAAGVAVAVTVPSLPLTITCFAIAGIASGPIFPMIVAIGGDRYPDRSASVAGILTGMGNIGAIAYPPMMGFLSVTIGLGAAMFGNALLALAAAATLVAFGRNVRDGVPAAIGQDPRTATS